ncbi:phosphotransferase family protein [Pseudalkalibacillus decolorationis]|uniref:phosphotransferase family protein n=1 Tax=Pseudalkalibacillus decolorationis TaxID=163879 RepID=UPI002147F406|nr:phosphotransferase [Pseudalkalibacillus decolorationis]
MALEQYLKCIQSFYPALKTNRVEWNHTGQNNDIVFLNDEWVFRFPKHDQALSSLQTEYEQLAFIRSYISLPIPDPHFVNTDTNTLGQAFFGYRKIHGHPLNPETILEAEPSDRQSIANELVTFLNQLHSIPIADAPGEKVTGNEGFQNWTHLFTDIKENLFPHMKPLKRIEVAEHFEAFLGNKTQIDFSPALIHGDFGSTNILYDHHLKNLSGIIDFGSCHIGDPAIDFAGLYKHYGEDFIKLMIPHYPGLSDLFPRIHFYSGTFALQEALYGHRYKDEEAFKNGLKEYV